uniref:TNase-like domain-containing protein n=1 Tax=Oryza punctata TaxID=4537 RepID=A0A0E0MBM1_ORYPU
MGNILRCFKGDDDGGGDHYPYYKPTSRPPDYHGEPAAPARAQQQQPLGPHGVTPSTVGVAALAHDLLNFGSTSMVPDGLNQHVASSRKAQVKWYQKMLEAYKNTTPPPKTPADAAQLIARALNMIQRADLEVYDKCIGDGDGFTAYVSTTDPRESANVPLEVHELVIARTQARKCRDYQSADALLSSLDEAGYKGIDAPELKMPYGKESRNALVKLIGGKRVKIYVYGLDQFGRYVGDIYCNNVFIQEQMLKNGHAWHFKTYDKRPEFARWEREARAANRGLWASGNPEKPWDWRRDQRNARQEAIQVY